MDARFLFRVGVLLPLLWFATEAAYAGFSYETANFVVNAPTAESARHFAEVAEQCREDLALLWLGETLPDWSAKCPVKIHVGNDLGAGGSTSFIFENGEVFGWIMEIQGSYERIIDSVLPHEIMHMVLASHFRKPLPRWLDEGIATSVEHKSEKANYRRMLRHFLQSDVQRCFPLNRMVAMKDYPSDPMPFYAQGFSLVEYLLAAGQHFEDCEHLRLVRFAAAGMEEGDWQSALREHYGIQTLGELQLSWIEWVDSDTPALPILAEVPRTPPPDYPAVAYQATANVPAIQTPVTQTSAKLPPPPANSVYDRRIEAVQTIPVSWSNEKAVPIPTSFGREVILR